MKQENHPPAAAPLTFSPNAPPRRDCARLWLLFGLLFLALGLFMAYDLQREYRGLTLQEEERLRAQARIVDNNLGRQLVAVNRALLNVIEALPVWRQSSDPDRSNQRLQAMVEAMPGVRTFLVFDRNGTVVAGNRRELIGQNFSYRDYYQTPLADPDPERLYLSPPFMTVLDIKAMAATRMISGPDREFAGVVSVTLDPGYFNILLGSVLYGPDMWVCLAHGGGWQFLLIPEQPEMAGREITQPQSFFSRHRESGREESFFVGLVNNTGLRRLAALHTIKPEGVPMDYPLVVAVTRDLEAVYAAWYSELWWRGGFFVALLLLGALGLGAYQRRQAAFLRLAAAGEAELRRSNAELEQFAYAASHDLRQPLRMITSYISLLDKDLADRLDERSRESMHFIRDGAIRMDRMLVALLEYSRVGRLGQPLEELRSCLALEEALNFLAPEIEESGAEIKISGEWPEVLASRDELVRLFQNLVGNALKYRDSRRQALIELAVARQGEEWLFTVRDNGVGIDPSQIHRLFQVFQRLHSRTKYEGSGIGLAICRKIVERHGGRIWAASAGPGQGALFSFTLPVMSVGRAAKGGK